VIDPPREAAAEDPRRGRDRNWLVTLPLAVLTLAVVLPVTVFFVASWLVGWRLQPVLSGSMEPTYPVGSLLVVQSIDASQVRPGMAVTFDDPGLPGRLVTHRVVAALPVEPAAFETQGDANRAPDPFPVPARSIRGHVLWHVPMLGFALDALAWPRGFVLLVLLPGLALLAGEILSRRRRSAGSGHLMPVRYQGP